MTSTLELTNFGIESVICVISTIQSVSTESGSNCMFTKPGRQFLVKFAECTGKLGCLFLKQNHNRLWILELNIKSILLFPINVPSITIFGGKNIEKNFWQEHEKSFPSRTVKQSTTLTSLWKRFALYHIVFDSILINKISRSLCLVWHYIPSKEDFM